MGTFDISQSYILVVLVGFAGLVYGAALYYRDQRFSEKSPWLRYTLFVLRFLAVSFIAFFLLEPFFKTIRQETRKPVLVMAQDASASIGAAHSADTLKKYLTDLDALALALEKDYDVQKIHFGPEVKAGFIDSFSMASTDLSAVYRYIDDRFYGIPLAGMILFSDGHFNKGQNPLYLENAKRIPTYALALGDTIKWADISIRNCYYNQIAFQGDSVGIRFDLSAFDTEGKRITATLLEVKDGTARPVHKEVLSIDQKEYFRTVDLAIKADKAGTLHYRIKLDGAGEERNTRNNVRDLFIEVIDSKIRVLIAANAPHPDITAIRQSLGSNPNFEVAVQFMPVQPVLTDKDVVILHNLPSIDGKGRELIQTLRTEKIAHFFITGIQSSIAAFNQAQDLVKIEGTLSSGNEVQARMTENFYAFTLDEFIPQRLRQMPPLTAPYGDYKTAAWTNTLLFQKIGQIETDYPLLSFSDRDGLKTGCLLGEGIWKWRLNEYGREGNHDAIDELLNKSILYLSLKEDKRRWQVQPDKKIWEENERIRFRASYYNASFEPDNQAESNIRITNESGENYEFLFSRKEAHYELDAGFLPPGSYKYTAIHLDGLENESYQGSFIIRPVESELAEREAWHNILMQLSQQSGGELLEPREMGAITDLLKSKDHKTIIYSQESYVRLLDLKWIFVLLLLLLSGEWFLRRYHGSY